MNIAIRVRIVFRSDDVDEKDRDDGHGDNDDRRRIDHRALDFAFQLGGFFDEYRDTGENRVQHTARLPGRHHVYVKVVEHLRVLLERLGERTAAFDVLFDGPDDVAEKLVLGLLAQDVEALYDRQAGVDHGGELPRKDHDVLGLHLVETLAFLAHARRVRLDPLIAQPAQHRLLVQRLHLTLHHFPLSCFSFPDKDRHKPLLFKVFRRRRRQSQVTSENTEPNPRSVSVTRTVSSIVVSPSCTFLRALPRSVLMPSFTASRLRSPAEMPRRICSFSASWITITS